MWKRFFVVMIVALLFIPASASADSESDCQKGIATLKSELKKKHPKPVQEQLQKALKNAQKEDGEVITVKIDGSGWSNRMAPTGEKRRRSYLYGA